MARRKHAPKRPQTPPNAPRNREARRAAGLDLLAQGRSVAEITLALDVDKKTVTRWARSEDGQRRIAEGESERQRERQADAVARQSTLAEARKRMLTLALRAVEKLDAALDDGDVHARLRAIREVLDRVGVPRLSKVEVSAAAADLSKLTDEELATLDALTAKASTQ